MNDVQGVIMFNKMLGEFGSVAVGSKCVSVFVKPYCEALTGLTHTHFHLVRACEFVYP